MSAAACPTGRKAWLSRREIIDAAVILSTGVVACGTTMYFNGLGRLYSLGHAYQGWDAEVLANVPLFLGIALSAFGVRRIADQRRERRRRLAAERRVRSLTLRDPLTRLPNRHCFEQELGAALRQDGGGTTVLLVDLNGFQTLTDLHGLAGGDAALSQAAARLRECVGHEGFLARFGDDEFSIRVGNADPDHATRIALAILDCLREPLQIGDSTRSLGATVGIAQTATDPLSVGEIMRRAHVALYRARSMHDDCCFYDEHMDSHIRRRSVLENDLRAAIGTDAIRPHYQPIVQLSTNRIIAFEALARWTHPEKGPIPPAVFVPIAEDMGLMDQLTNQLFRMACRDAADWPDEISLAFNISPGQLKDRGFGEKVLAILSSTRLPPHRFEAEVTESALVTDLGAAREVLGALRAAGVRIVMDDFGTGFSSLYHLRELRFDKLKIDGSFVQNMGSQSESTVIVRAIIGLSKGLGLLVTAEGIETNEQASAILDCGAQQGQGFLFSRPMPAGEAKRLLTLDEPADTQLVA
jgi:diguanylate cyclase (GGDEF)-like protein